MNDARYLAAERNYWGRYKATPETTWLELPDPRTRVRVQEFGDGPPLLLVHGGPSAGSTFAPLAAHLGSFRCIVLDRPGCGLSPPIRYGRTPLDETLPSVLGACLDALGLAKVSILGSSFGGACALWFALRQPERVEKLVLMGCPPFIGGARMPVFLRLLATPLVGALLCRLPAGRSASLAYLDAMGQQKAKAAGAIPEEFLEWHVSLGRDTDTMIHDRDLICHGLTSRGMRPELIIPEERLRSLPHPLYVYWGEDDPLAETAYARELFGSLPRGSVDVIPHAGHLPWLDDPAAAAERTRGFLAT